MTETNGDLTRWESRIRAMGYRMTPQRERILRAIRDLPHPSQETILSELAGDGQSVNRSTVYRTLSTLEDLGLIAHTHVGSGSPVYHLADWPEHVHLQCTRCQGMTSVPVTLADSMVVDVAERVGFRLDIAHTALYGVCQECWEAED